MKEKRLYNLAYETLLGKWSRENDLLNKYPDNEIAKIREHELWIELQELRNEMDSKGY